MLRAMCAQCRLSANAPPVATDICGALEIALTVTVFGCGCGRGERLSLRVEGKDAPALLKLGAAKVAQHTAQQQTQLEEAYHRRRQVRAHTSSLVDPRIWAPAFPSTLHPSSGLGLKSPVFLLLCVVVAQELKSADASLVQKVTTFGDAVARSNRRAHTTRDTDLKKTAVSTCTPRHWGGQEGEKRGQNRKGPRPGSREQSPWVLMDKHLGSVPVPLQQEQEALLASFLQDAAARIEHMTGTFTYLHNLPKHAYSGPPSGH